jgi:hypothetical protein
MDNRERDKFYSSADEDDEEYELEPPDAEVTAAAERNAREIVEASEARIDIDEIYRDAGQQRSDEILEKWVRDFKFGFRFQVKHLLVATALLAIVLTIYRLGFLGPAFFVLIMLSVAGVYFYLQWQEKQAQEQAARRRHEMYERRRAHMQKMMAGPSATGDAAVASTEVPKTPEPLPNETDLAWQEAMSKEKFRIRFSVAELLIAVTTAAIILGLVQVLGGASNTATLLGFVALIGLVIHALGFEPPGIVVLGWWFILVLYVLLSIVVAVWTGFA